MSYTPMIRQYLTIKEQAGDALLFFRLGDFYEMFFEDAKLASKLLEITLTGREGGGGERIPMCGVPYHSAENYIQRLVDQGYKVAICEQVEDPTAAKGIVRREIVQIITPGTRVQPEGDSKSSSNLLQYLVAVIPSADGEYAGIAACDVSTGEFFVIEKQSAHVRDFLLKIAPSELVSVSTVVKGWVPDQQSASCVWTEYTIKERPSDWSDYLLRYFSIPSLEQFSFAERKLALQAAGLLLAYVQETQRRHLAHLKLPTWLDEGDSMPLDATAIRNLELVQGIRDLNESGTLFHTLNRTRSAAGARMLRQWLVAPSRNRRTIEFRADAVQVLVDDPIFREDVRDYLGEVYDLERLLARVSYGTANARDLIAIRATVQTLPGLHQLLQLYHSTEMIGQIQAQLVDLTEIRQLLETALRDQAPVSVREGGMIRPGFHQELDELTEKSQNGREYLAQLEVKEREATGIRALKIGYTKVFGYYFEVTKANLQLVPSTWRRKQTLSNGERYVSEELQRFEEILVHADERRVELEYQIFCGIREQVRACTAQIQQVARGLAMLDVLQSFATVSAERGYIRPVIHEEPGIRIELGRHPVVEATRQDTFVANDVLLDPAVHQIAILTGPNMAGKSTYMRQVALLVIMAQIGCFVPASACELGIVDRVFTRIGAADDLAKGQSTFMVEMVELAQILHNATARSLLLLDEVGRGTSTYDGMAIAQAVLEHLHQHPSSGPMTLFATHYHELTPLAGQFDRMFNLSMHVQEVGDDVVFLRRVLNQPADRSYGIQVAKLAGLPACVLQRAQQILQEVEQERMPIRDAELTDSSQQLAWTIAADQSPQAEDKPLHWLQSELAAQSINEMTPLEALQKLADWKARFEEEQKHAHKATR